MKKNILLLFCISFLLFKTTAASGKDFASVEVKCEESPGISLGQTIRIGVVAVTDKGKEFRTPGFLAPGILKTVEWTEFKIEVEGGSYEDGTITISKNISIIKNYEVKIKVSCVNNPEIKNETSIKLNFKGTTIASFKGTDGRDGNDGREGPSGQNAVTSSDQAGSGGMGGPGGQGGDGKNGQDIEVYVKLQKDEILQKDMLFVLVKSKTTGNQYLYLVDPDGGKLIVNADGGDGGQGGEGGRGGKGGDDSYRQISGNGGQGGSGGNGGNGSDGGAIIVHMDPGTDKINSDVIKFSNAGGAAGESGRGGAGGFKGYYESSGGHDGVEGGEGQAGNKGPAIQILKQAVDVKMEALVVNSENSGNSRTNNTQGNSTEGNSSSTTSSGKPKSVTNMQFKVTPTNTDGMSEWEKNKENGNGPYKYFDEGKVVQEGNYKNGEMVGLWTSYDLQGNITSKYYYNSEGEADSLFLYTGKVVTKASRFKNGKKNGRQEEFFDNGKLKELQTYKDDDQEGKAAQYNEDGSIYFEGNYKEGKKEGLWKEDDSGDLAEGNYKNDARDGVWTVKDRTTKKVIRTEKYVNGELQG